MFESSANVPTRVVREITREPAIVHCSSVACLNDRIVTVWYEGPYETARNTSIRMSSRPLGVDTSEGLAASGSTASGRAESGNGEWAAPRTVLALPEVPLGNPVIWTEGEHGLRMLFSVLMGEAWTESTLATSFSADGGETWGAPTIFLARRGFMGKTRPVHNRDGELVLPIYDENMYAPFVAITPSVIQPEKTRVVAETMARGKVIQPAIAALSNGHLLMLGRSNQGTIWRSQSPNDGYSWSICRATALPNPDAGIDLIRLSDGDLCLVWNNSAVERTSLSVSLSSDDGESWYCLRDVVRGDGEYSYPSVTEDAFGVLHITYTEDRYRILEAEVATDWVRDGKLAEPLRTSAVSHE